MPNENVLTIYLESRPDELLLRGILAELAQQDLVRFSMNWTSSSAMGMAKTALLMDPSRHVALVAKAEAEPDDIHESPERTRDLIESYLRAASPRGTWHVAMAIPDPTTWVRLDPAFATELQTAEAADGPLSIHRIAALFTDWTANHTFDRAAAAGANDEFAALNQFVEQCTSVAANS